MTSATTSTVGVAGTAPATMREAFADTVSAALDRDGNLALVLAEISTDAFTGAAARHPHRVLNLGIREQLLVSVCGGLALAGMRPVGHSYAPFLVERAFEQVKLDLGHQDVGAVLVSIGASYDASAGGRTHQSPGDVTLLDSLPGWAVHVPGHPAEAAALLEQAIAAGGRVYVRLSTEENPVPLAEPDGRLRVLRRGSLGTVVAVGPMLAPTLQATAGLDVTVAYTATPRPFDTAGLHTLASPRPDVVLVEPYLAGTSAHVVAGALADLPHRLLTLGVPRDREHRGYGSPSDHAAAHALDPAGIARSLHQFLGR
ncbi:MAG TPA: transketolase [Mycobacteriales bacterium]|nr:transketolase [Mycobacteriales bacterium]